MNLSGTQFEMFWIQYDLWAADFYSEHEYEDALDPASENPYCYDDAEPGCARCGKLSSDHYWDGDGAVAYCDEMDRDEYGNFWGDPMRTYLAAPMQEVYDVWMDQEERARDDGSCDPLYGTRMDDADLGRN